MDLVADSWEDVADKPLPKMTKVKILSRPQPNKLEDYQKDSYDPQAAFVTPVVLTDPDEQKRTQYAPETKVMIMKRPAKADESSNFNKPKQPVKTLEQRQQEYNEARKRILGNTEIKEANKTAPSDLPNADKCSNPNVIENKKHNNVNNNVKHLANSNNFCSETNRSPPLLPNPPANISNSKFNPSAAVFNPSNKNLSSSQAPGIGFGPQQQPSVTPSAMMTMHFPSHNPYPSASGYPNARPPSQRFPLPSQNFVSGPGDFHPGPNDYHSGSPCAVQRQVTAPLYQPSSSQVDYSQPMYPYPPEQQCPRSYCQQPSTIPQHSVQQLQQSFQMMHINQPPVASPPMPLQQLRAPSAYYFSQPSMKGYNQRCYAGPVYFGESNFPYSDQQSQPAQACPEMTAQSSEQGIVQAGVIKNIDKRQAKKRNNNSAKDGKQQQASVKQNHQFANDNKINVCKQSATSSVENSLMNGSLVDDVTNRSAQANVCECEAEDSINKSKKKNRRKKKKDPVATALTVQLSSKTSAASNCKDVNERVIRMPLGPDGTKGFSFRR